MKLILFTAIYSVFTMMLNMVDLTKFDLHNQVILYLIHIAYIFIIAILLLNFLIALLSNSVAEVADHRKISLITQQLSVVLSVDRVLGKFQRWMFRSWLKKQGIVMENNRVYIVTVRQQFRKNMVEAEKYI